MADEEPLGDELVPAHVTPENDPVNPEPLAPKTDIQTAEPLDLSGVAQSVFPVNIEDEMRTSFLNYSMAVIISRALPDVRDGLKPVQRRILMAMHDLNLTPGAQHRKSAKIAGDTSGNYHPHGEAVVYPTMVRMAQSFSLRYPLVDGQGNFGCFTGDTKISLLDGTEKSFAELATLPSNEVFHVYSVDAEGRVVVGEGRNSRITRRGAELLEVVLDNGEHIRCTPDHRFMLRDGTYQEAQFLTAQDSLMPGYFRQAKIKERLNEYLQVMQPSTGEYEFVHCLADQFNEERGIAHRMTGPFVRHHKNFNRFDNRPANIERMDFLEHLHLHAAQIAELWHDENFRAAQREGVVRYFNDHPEARETRRVRLTERNKSEEFRSVNGARTSRGLKRRFENDPQAKAEISRRMAALWTDPDYRAKMSIVLSGIEKRALSPEDKARVAAIISEKSLAMWGDQAKRAELVEAITAAMATEEVRAKVSAGVKRLWQTPEYRAKYGEDHFAKMANALWSDPEMRSMHSEKLKQQRQDPEFQAKARLGRRQEHAKRVHENPNLMQDLAALSAKSLTQKWKDPEHGRQVLRRRIARYGSILLTQHGSRENITPEVYEASRNEVWMPKLETALKYYENFDALLDAAQTYNHKVMEIRWLDEREDVYDITVDTHHNFLLSSGVFVHNSVDGDPPAAMRYCVSSDTLTLTNRGLLPMGQISSGEEDIDLRVLSQGGVTNNADKWFDSGEHPTWRVRTRHGYEITGTSNHPLLVCQADARNRPSFVWKTIAALTPGDTLVLDRSNSLWPEEPVDVSEHDPILAGASRTQRHTLPRVVDEDFAFLLGALTAEGTVCADKIEFTNTHGDFADTFQQKWAQVFPTCRLHVFERQPVSYGKKPFLQMQVVSQQVVAFLKSIGLNGNSATRQVPDAILQSPQRVVAAFLRGLFEGDGAVERSGRSLLRVNYCSKSQVLLRQVQTLLLRFGVVCSRWADGNRGTARLCIVGEDNIRRFAVGIGFASQVKQNALAEVMRLNTGKALSQKDYIPLVAAYVRQHAVRHREWLTKNNFDRPARMTAAMPRLMAALQDASDIQMLQTLNRLNYLYDPVTEIEYAGIQPVYSIRVDSPCHSFVANGFVNHNTEARMSPFGVQLLTDLDKDTVDWTENYDQTRQEPTVLPAAFPNFLCNGGEGIAVGMATKVPPHNLREVVDALIHLVDKPNATIDDLMEHLQGPDFPTAALILGKKGIRQAYETGRGTVTMQAKTQIDSLDNGKSEIIVTELPYQVNKARLIEQIADLVKQKKIDGITDVNDFSDRTGMRVVVSLRRDAYPKKILNFLLKHTPLRLNFGVNTLALVNNQPRLLTLKETLGHYLEHRRDVIRRRTLFDLNRAKARAHILEGLQIAIDVLDDIIALIRRSRTPDSARAEMMERYALSQLQADAILAMQLRQLTALERDKIETDYKELLKQIAYLEDILQSPARVNQIIKQELRGLRDKHGDERRTRLIPTEADEIGEEDMIPEEETIISITRDGYIKRVDKDTYRTQRRGGRGKMGAATREEDAIAHLFVATTHHYILFFTDRGRVYRLKAYEVPQTSRQAMGTAVINLINVAPDERITAVVPMREYKETDGYLLFVTECGEVKRTSVSEFANLRASGLICFDIEENDALRWVAHTTGENEIILVTRKGMSIRFPERDVPSRGRAAGGVRGIRLSAAKDDRVVGMAVVDATSDLLVISEFGMSKRTPFKSYREQGRGGIGIRTMSIGPKAGDVVDAKAVTSDDKLLIMTKNGVTISIDVSTIRNTVNRDTKGVHAIKLDAGDSVASVERVTPPKVIEEIEEIVAEAAPAAKAAGKPAKAKKA